MPKNFYIELAENRSGANIQLLLQAAKMKPKSVRETTSNHDGVIFTDLLISRIWEKETAGDNCVCPAVLSGRSHKSWDELSDEQRRVFAARLADWLNETRSDLFEADAVIPGRDFPDVRLICDD